MKRNCFVCKVEIYGCMGFVLARDFLAAMTGMKEWNQVRELCGRCSEKVAPQDIDQH